MGSLYRLYVCELLTELSPNIILNSRTYEKNYAKLKYYFKFSNIKDK